MAPHSRTLAWKIPWVEEPGRLQSMGSRRVGHDWATWLSLFTFMHWKRKWQPTPVFLPGESQAWGTWWAAVYGVTQSRTRLKWLSSSSSRAFQVALAVKSLPANVGDTRDECSVPGWRRSPRRRAWQLIPVSLPGKSNGHKSLAGYSPWGRKESDATEVS